MTEEAKDRLQAGAFDEERGGEREPSDQSNVEAIGSEANVPDEIVTDYEAIEAEAVTATEEEDLSLRFDDSIASGSSSSEEPASEVSIPAQDDDLEVTATRAELKPVIEALLFVAEEPLAFNQLCKILGDVQPNDVRSALDELVTDYEQRESGLEIREIAGGWRISTRPQHHEFIRKYLKSKPTARLSLPALETLAVIAYKQPITVPEILEIRGVSSTSAIKTLLEKRLIVTKGRKETVGRPMMYGTSKEFLMQFGMRDLSELPSIEDFEDLAG